MTSASSPRSRLRLNASYCAQSEGAMRDSQNAPFSMPSGTVPPIRLSVVNAEA